MRKWLPKPADDEFFIGWLRMPPGHARAVRRVAAVLLLFAAAAAALLAAGQQSPGGGVWETGSEVTMEGVAYAAPYALLRATDASDGAAHGGGASPVRTILLVEEGKRGAVERVAPFDGRPVRVTGTLLHRDDRWMLELSPGDVAIVELSAAGHNARWEALRPQPSSLGRITLRGEIIDPKCYLGAMKPGGGKTHKACAALCLAGGVPPMFVTRDAERRETFYLLTDTSGAAVGRQVLPFVGDAVELTGELLLDGDLRELRIDLATIRRR